MGAPLFVYEPSSALTKHYKTALAEERLRILGQPSGSAAEERWHDRRWVSSIRNWRLSYVLLRTRQSREIVRGGGLGARVNPPKIL